MKSYIASILFAFLACSCTNSSIERTEVATDTAITIERDTVPTLELNLPAKKEEKAIATAEELVHGLIIHKEGFSFNLDGKSYQLKNENELQAFISANRQRIVSRRLSVVSSDPPESYKDVVDAFDALTIANIKDFKTYKER